MKRCFKCKRIKPVDKFYKHGRMADGYLNKCITCTKKDVRRRYYDPESRPRIKEYERKRFQSAHRKAKALEYAQKRRIVSPGKTKARARLSRAVKKGIINREPCEVCGEAKSQAHHTDYRKAFDVRWLCFTHHREAHGQLID